MFSLSLALAFECVLLSRSGSCLTVVYSTAIVGLHRDLRHLQDFPWLLWPVLVIQRSFQCESIGSLSLVAPTSTLIKYVFPVLLSPVCRSVGRCSSTLCVPLSLLYRLNLAGHARSIYYNWRPTTGLNPRPDFIDHVAVFRSSLPSSSFFLLS